MSANDLSSRKLAALAFALGIVRGQLSSFLDGDFDEAEASTILHSTSAANIAKVLGLKETDLAADWDQYLSELEKQLIQGGGAAH
jgi:hypothetical protein